MCNETEFTVQKQAYIFYFRDNRENPYCLEDRMVQLEKSFS